MRLLSVDSCREETHMKHPVRRYLSSEEEHWDENVIFWTFLARKWARIQENSSPVTLPIYLPAIIFRVLLGRVVSWTRMRWLVKTRKVLLHCPSQIAPLHVVQFVSGKRRLQVWIMVIKTFGTFLQKPVKINEISLLICLWLVPKMIFCCKLLI